MTARCSFEIEVTLSGRLVPFREATWARPSEGGEVEDLDVEDVGIVERDARFSIKDPRAFETYSILDGIDLKNPEIQKLFANLIDLKRQEFEEAIAEDA